LSKAYLYFDVAFVVVIISLLLQGWTLAAQPGGCTWRCPHRSRNRGGLNSNLPASWSSSWSAIRPSKKSVFPARLIPSWTKPTLVIRDQHILSPRSRSGRGGRLHLPA